MYDNLKLSIIMPAYNEKDTIEKILTKVIAVEPKNKEIIIVDDCSTDGTKEILVELQNRLDFKLIINAENSGKGYSFIKGLSFAQGDIAIPQDADLEVDPNDYARLMNAMIENDADVVFGSRLKNAQKQSYILRTLLANKIFVYLVNLLYGGCYTDIMTCYKMCKMEVFRNINLSSSRFGMEPEIACKVLKKKYKIVEIPISYYPRRWHEGKKIKWTDTFDILKTILKYRFVD